MWVLKNYGAYRHLMISYTSSLHFLWAVLLILDPSSGFATTTATLIMAFNGYLIPLLILAGVLALVGLWLVNHPMAALMLMLPQQMIWFVAAFGAAKAIFLGQYGDGTIRSSWFICADQAPIIGIALFYTFAIWEAAVRKT